MGAFLLREPKFRNTVEKKKQKKPKEVDPEANLAGTCFLSFFFFIPGFLYGDSSRDKH